MNPLPFLDDFESEMQAHLKPTSWSKVEPALKGIRKWLKTQTKPTVNDYAKHLKRSKAQSVERLKLIYFNRFMKWSAERGYVEPAQAAFTLVPDKKPQKRRPPITVEEYHRILEVCDDGWKRMFFKIGWHTGMRISDATRFNVSYISHEERAIIFTPIKTERHGKQCMIPVSDGFFDELTSFETRNGWFFEHARLSYDPPWRMVRKVFNKAEVRNKTYHCFRHAFVTRMLAAGMTAEMVSLMTGHSVEQVMQYQRVTPAMLRERLRQCGIQN